MLYLPLILHVRLFHLTVLILMWKLENKVETLSRGLVMLGREGFCVLTNNQVPNPQLYQLRR